MIHVKDFAKVIKSPVIAWLCISIIFLIVSFVKGVADMFMDVAVLGPIALFIGFWTGQQINKNKGTKADMIMSSIVVGVLAGVFMLVLLGLIPRIVMATLIPASVFVLAMTVIGAKLGHCHMQK